jgi:hypothetical protein
VAPVALSGLVLLPLKLALYGGDAFHAGGADQRTGENVFLVLQLGFVAWSLGLLVVGVRVVHGWSWPRAAGVVAVAAALLGAIVALFAML